MSKLENEKKNTMFEVKPKEQLRLTNSDKLISINKKWKMMQDSIKTVSETVMGKPMKTKKLLFDEVCKLATNQMRELRTIWLNDPRNMNCEVLYKRCQIKNIMF